MSTTIVRIAARGDGVAGNGRFVAGTAPGDVLHDDGTIEPGPHRVTPPCRHFGLCGGCQLQQVDIAAYATFLVDRVVGALHEHAIAAPAIGAPQLSPARSRRRTSLRAERRGRQILLGFSEAASNRIVDLRECHVVLPELFALFAPLRVLLAVLLADRARAAIMLTRADQGVDMALSGFAADTLPKIEALSDFARRHALARLSLDDGGGPTAHWSPQPPTIMLGGRAVGLPIGGFLQATADGEAALVAAVLASVGTSARTIDLFAGLGTFALALPGSVTAIEGSRDAALALAATRAVRVEHRDLFRRPLAATEFAGVDAVVLDPPRAGAREQVVELARAAVPRIAYVSCNPATFARDARFLIDGGYTLTRIVPVGQFVWSTHVELVASFAR